MKIRKKNRTVGSALVVGGGIAGMQASLDLAESGIKVYLVENKPSIGGVMTQLDKTFPTNDCAMCTIAPRLVGIDRHKDVEILTLTDVERVQGKAGHFRVQVRRKARYVDESKCTGCGLCFSGCPVTLPNGFDLGLSDQKAIYSLFPQAVPNKAAINKTESRPCNAACEDTCPVHTNVPAYVKLIAEGRFEEAYRMNRDVNPFPSVCGRVCYAPCEKACNRSQLDAPVSIRNLKRFVADRINLDDLPVPHITKSGKGVAIIGAGPAGLAAANDLALQGHSVVVYEAREEAGGMLRYGIPEYRLPRAILRQEINYIRRLGVEIKTGITVGTDITLESLRTGSHALFVGAGAQGGMMLGVEGSDLQGVTDGIEFLRRVNAGETVTLGGKVAIIGGGNTAIDCARTAKRLGVGEVRIVYRRSRNEMPAAPEEIDDARREGISFEFLTIPRRFISSNGSLSAMECSRMTLGEPDASGRRRPVVVPGSEFIVPVETVIAAIGQTTQLEFLRALGLTMGRNDTIQVDPNTGETSIGGVFAGGDVATGAAFVIDAIAGGKAAARSIGRYLGGGAARPADRGRIPQQLGDPEISGLRERFPTEPRTAPAELPVADRIDNFREVLSGFTEEQAVAEAKRCLAGKITGCIECGECDKRCDARAIDYRQQDRLVDIDVGAIVLAPGCEIFDAGTRRELGFGRYPNVVNALQLERILSPTGPYGGHVRRPSDLKAPKRIAFLQCVGSRDAEHDYCSAVCCMYATKEAIIAKEHVGADLQCDIFFMDVRAYSKGFEAYFESAKKVGIQYIRCRVPVIRENPDTHDLTISYLAGDDRRQSAEYDLVVLSVGMVPLKKTADLARVMGVELNPFGFCATSTLAPVESTREGIYVAGPFAGPKDIPESVVEGSAAASKVLSLLRGSRGSLIRSRSYPQETDVRGQKPRIGVFVCHCGTNIGSVVNVPDIVGYARTLDGVVYAENNLYTCSNDTQERIKSMIREHNLNRVVVASCTPRTHEPLFRNTLREAGLNPFLFEMANIRDQCSWVHMHEPEKATAKARDLLRIALAKVKLNEPLHPHMLEINHDALVVGGGIAGMTAAFELAEQGYGVHLVEKDAVLGGYLRKLRRLITGEDPWERVAAIARRVMAHEKIRVHLDSTLVTVSGSLGNFTSTISTAGNGNRVEVKHGVVIVATGAEMYRPSEYLYGQDRRVLVAEEWEERFESGSFRGDAVAFLQCVGSRNAERTWCSRTCCSETVKHAIALKEKRPDAGVFVLYREMRTYGFNEAYYSKARKLGVAFIRFADDNPPVVVGHNGKLSVMVRSETLQEATQLLVDNVVLAAATVPRESNRDLAQLLKVPLGDDRFFLEAHRKLRPIDFATDGIYVCGNAHSPLGIDETISQALGTAARASTVLSREKIDLDPTISHVVEENCDGCGYCVEPCPYKAIALIEHEVNGEVKKRVEVNDSLCKGCGCCMATCPKKAIFVWHFRPEMLSAEVQVALGREAPAGVT